jgi:glycosyltransferase involved in cell wall biosynthesis
MISILMPLYNGANFLNTSVQSVRKQSFTDWELLIGINGWMFNDNQMIRKGKKYIQAIQAFNDPRISIKDLPCPGKIKTLNALVGCAKYDTICLLDADDLWLPLKLEKQFPLMNKYDVVGSNAVYFGDRNDSPNLLLGELSMEMFSYQNPIINSAVMLKKSDAQWKEEWEGLDDFNLWVHLLEQQKRFFNVPEILVKHRIHKGSYFNANNEEVHKKLRDEKLPKLSEEQLNEIVRIWDNKDWKL